MRIVDGHVKLPNGTAQSCRIVPSIRFYGCKDLIAHFCRHPLHSVKTIDTYASYSIPVHGPLRCDLPLFAEGDRRLINYAPFPRLATEQTSPRTSCSHSRCLARRTSPDSPQAVTDVAIT